MDEEKWLNMLVTFVKVWFCYESHFLHGRDSLLFPYTALFRPRVKVASAAYRYPVRISTFDYKTWSDVRSEEHTSELQSRQYLVCRLLLEKQILCDLSPSTHDSVNN